MDEERKKAASEVERFSRHATKHANRGELKMAIPFFLDAYKSTKILNVPKTMRSCAFNLGAAYVAIGDAKNGIMYLNKALPPEDISDDCSNGDLYYNFARAYELKQTESSQTNDAIQIKNYLEKAYQAYSSEKVNTEMEIIVLKRLIHMKDPELKCLKRLATAYQKNEEPVKYAATLLDQLEFYIKENFEENYIPIANKCFEAIENLEKQGPDITVAKMYNRLGLFYTSVCKYRCAKICFEHAKENLPDEDNIITAVILQNLGTACSLLREFKEASKYQAQAAKIYGKFKEEEQQGHCFLNQGYAYSQLRMLEEAKDAFLQASFVAARCDDKMSEWQAQESLGAVEANLNRFDRARNHLEEALYAARLHSNDKHSKSCQRIFLKLQQVVRLIPSKRMTEELKPLNTTNKQPGGENYDADVHEDITVTVRNNQRLTDTGCMMMKSGSLREQRSNRQRSLCEESFMQRQQTGTRSKRIGKRMSSNQRYDPQGKPLHTVRLKHSFLSPFREEDDYNAQVKEYEKLIADQEAASGDEAPDISEKTTQRHNSTDEFEVHQYSTETDLDTDWDTDSVTDTESETHSDRGDQSRKPLPEPPDSSKELFSKTQEIPPTSTRPDPTQTTSNQQLPDEDEKRESEKLQKTDHYVSKGVNLFNNADDSGDGVSGAQSPHVSDTTQTQTGGDISKGAMEKGKTKQKTTTQQQKSTVKAEVHQHSTETDLDTDWDTDTVTDAKSETHSDHGDQFREPQPVPPDSSKEPDPTQSTSNQKQLPAANNTYDSVYLGTNNCASLKIDSSVKSNQEEQGGEELKTESLHADEKQESEELQNKYQYLSKGVNFFHDADDSGEAVSGAQSPHVTDMTQTQTGGEPERDDRKMDDTEYETVARKQDTEAEQDNKETDKDGDLTKSEDPVSRHSPQEDGHDRGKSVAAPDTDAKKTEDASMEENDSTDEESCVGRAQREQRMLKFHQEHETPQKIEEDKNHSKICTIV